MIRNWLGQSIEVGSTVYRGARAGNSSSFRVGTVTELRPAESERHQDKARVQWIKESVGWKEPPAKPTLVELHGLVLIDPSTFQPDDEPEKPASGLPPLSAIITEIRRLAAENPDFVYEKPPGCLCVNWVLDKDGKKVGSCIVGQALINVGISADRFAAEGAAGELLFNLGYKFDSMAVSPGWEWIRDVQVRQDEKHTWSKSIELADLEAAQENA